MSRIKRAHLELGGSAASGRIGRLGLAAALLAAVGSAGCGDDDDDADGGGEPLPPTVAEPPCHASDGQCIFRHDTLGDEQLWTDVLRLHQLVQTLPPTEALALGLKVDAAAVPEGGLAMANLDDPATTVSLIELDAIVGIHGEVISERIVSIGITCALCHSTVDDSVAPGIGNRLDGWPNRDLDPGRIISLTPGVADYAESLGAEPGEVIAALQSWGPGRYDARFNQDGESFPVLIPPAYGLADVPLVTYTGDGPISYWNAYVAVTQMGAHGNFSDERLGIDIEQQPDRVTPVLQALRDYQVSLEAPPPPPGSFDPEAAARGQLVFEGPGLCASCHPAPSFSDAPALHAAEETGMEPNEARRSLTGRYRSTPLRGVWQHPPYFHDGSAATLEDVVAHYDAALELDLSARQQADLVQYLLSL